MAASRIAATSAINNTTVSKPAGTVSGSLLVAVVSAASTTVTVTPPAGFTEFTAAFASNAGISSQYRVFWKIAGGSEPTTYTFTNSATVYQDTAMVAYSPGTGTWATTPSDAAATGTATNVTTAGTTLPAVTTTVAGDVVVGVISSGGSPTWSGTAPLSAAVASWDGNGILDAIITAAGSSGSLVAKPSVNQTGTSMITVAAFKLTASGGAAAVLAASGSGQATATITGLVQTQPLAASGAATATGAATRLNQTQPLATNGAGAATGVATRLSLTATLTATGNGVATSEATRVNQTQPLAATGAGTAGGTVPRLALYAQLTATGNSAAGGTANLTPDSVVAALSVSVSGVSTGMASLSLTARLMLLGDAGGVSDGLAELTVDEVPTFDSRPSRCPLCYGNPNCFVCGGSGWTHLRIPRRR